MNVKRFAYGVAAASSTLWIGTAAHLSISPGIPFVAESAPVVAEIRGQVVEREGSAQAEAALQAEATGTEVLGAVEIVPSQLDRTKTQLSTHIVEVEPPAPQPTSPPAQPDSPPPVVSLQVRLGVSSGTAQAGANLSANLGWLSLP